MKQLVVAISICFLLQNHNIFSQQVVTANRHNDDISLIDLNNKVDSIFAHLNNGPGCAVTIIENGELLVKKSFGFASIENEVEFNHQSIVRIPYSEAREFISIGAVLMEYDGLFSLDDKVNKYFPRLPDWSESVTIWDLLNHRSGFVDEWATLLLMHNSMSNRFEKEQFLRLLYNQIAPEIEPGEGYMYSNSDFGLLRLIMEKASGFELPDWMRQRVFKPLNMNCTSMQKSPLDIIPRKALMYEDASNGGFMLANVQKTSPGGNYYILTSADDLEQWSMAFNQPASEIFRAASRLIENVRRMPGKVNHYIIGYSYDSIANHKVILHEGVNGYNYLTRIPSLGLSVITIGNRSGNGFAEENRDMVNYIFKQASLPLPELITEPINLPKSDIIKFIGDYRWQNQVSWEGSKQTRKFSTIFLDGNKLKMRYQGNYIIDLIPVGKNLFYYQEGNKDDGFGVQFEFTQGSEDSTLMLTATFDDGFPGVLMAKSNEATWTTSKEVLAEFTGKFYSRHLDYYWNIELNEEGTLILKSTNLPDIELNPDGYNQFHCIGEKYPGSGFDRWLLFNKNDQDEITHITVWSERVMHHRFDKQ